MKSRNRCAKELAPITAGVEHAPQIRQPQEPDGVHLDPVHCECGKWMHPEWNPAMRFSKISAQERTVPSLTSL
jgi:hypothetical protein